MKVIDITGPVYTGMFSYEDPFPKFELSVIGYEFAGRKYSYTLFKGMHGQVGTYLETNGMYDELNAKPAEIPAKIPLEKLIMMDAYVYLIDHDSLAMKNGRPCINLDDLKKVEKDEIRQNSAILVGTGYGKNWESNDYLEKSWFFSKEAFFYLIDQKPFLLGGDSPFFENQDYPEGTFDRFYKSEILLLAPLINIEKISKFRVKLTALPMKVLEVPVCPVRAVVIED